VAYVSQAVHSFQPATVVHTTSKSPAGKYQPASQSAFTTYPTHYAQHQKPPMPEAQYQAYQLQRMPQPGNTVYLKPFFLIYPVLLTPVI